MYEDDGLLVLGAGLPEKWLSDKEGVSIGNFPTFYGNISYSVKEEDGALKIKAWGTAHPPKGFVFRGSSGGEVTFQSLPFSYPP